MDQSKAINRLAEYCVGPQLFGDKDTQRFREWFKEYTTHGLPTDRATLEAHKRVVARILQEELK